MPNKRYRKGYELERAVMAEWRTAGYEVIRAAGSHGCGDVWAATGVDVRTRRGETWVSRLCFIQCKAGSAKMSGAERKALVRSADNAGATPLMATRPYRKAIEYYLVYEDGVEEYSPF